MYFTNISDEELLQFHEQVKVTFNINLQDAISSSLFKVQSMDSIIQLYPLFYTDTIKSSNSNDKVLSNRSIICENNDNTTLFFISSEDIPVLSLDYSYYTDNANYFVFYTYDGNTGNYLSGVTAEVVFKQDDTEVYKSELESDEKGIIYIDSSDITFDEVEIDFSITDVTETFTWSG